MIGGVLGARVILFLTRSWVPCRARTIALETGIQNGPLAALIGLLSFSGTQPQQVLLVPVLYSLFIVPTSSAVTGWFRRITKREEAARDRATISALAGPKARRPNGQLV